MRNATVFSVLVVVLLFASSALSQSYRADIDGGQPVPPTLSPGTGLGCFTLDAAKMLNYQVAFSGLISVEIAAHIHCCVPVGLNAGVLFPFALGTPKIGAFGPLTAAQEADLNAGLMYVNIHSVLFPGGEIRGQIFLNPAGCTVPVHDRTWGAIKSLYE